jgi:alpha-L-fucosidase
MRALLVCGIAAATPAAAMSPNFADGQLAEFWLDGASGDGHVHDFRRFVEKLRLYQPNTLIFADGRLRAETFVSCRVCNHDATF